MLMLDLLIILTEALMKLSSVPEFPFGCHFKEIGAQEFAVAPTKKTEKTEKKNYITWLL